MTIENRLGDEQTAQAQAFLERLSPVDRANVEKITEVLASLSRKYDEETLQFRDALFGAYVIGGKVHKEGPRPDIDLLIIGNASFRTGYDWLGDIASWEQVKGDWVMGSLRDQFAPEGFEVEVPGQIPDEYDMGLRVKDVKMMMRLRPPEGSQASPIDIVYMKVDYISPLPSGDQIESFEDFYRADVDSEGNDLGRIALFEAIIKRPTPPPRL
jgi:hypothetical protein